VKPSSRKVVTRYAPRTTRVVILPKLFSEPIECESSLERDFVFLAALCHGVTSIRHQPFELALGDKRYTPDFLVQLDGGDRVIVEIKVDRKLEEYRALFNEAAKHLASHGYQFMVATEATLRAEKRHQRSALLLRYVKTSFGSDCDRAVSTLQLHPSGLPLGTLQRKADVGREVIFHLVAMRQASLSNRLVLDDSALVQPKPKEAANAIRFASWIGCSLWA
jgi:hypothetical protein